MKRLISILLIICMLSVLLVSCSNNSDTNDDNKTIGQQYSKGLAFEACENDPSTCVITGIGSCTDKNIVIPTIINGMRVVGIKAGAFSPKKQEVAFGTKLTQVLANDITDSMLAGLMTDSSQDSDEQNNQDGDIKLENFNGGAIYLPTLNGNGVSASQDGGNAENYETGTGTPIDLEKIESVQIPLTVKEIGDEAFYGCEDLNSINTHSALSSIGKDAFKETAYYNNPQNWDGQALYLSNYLLTVSEGYTGEFTVKEGTTMIADQAFYKCVYVTNVNMAESVTAVGSYAFYGCTSFTGFTNLNGTEAHYSYVYGTGAFDGCISFAPTPVQPNPVVPSNPDKEDNEASEEKYPEIFDRVDETKFEQIKKNPKDEYTAETTYSNSEDVGLLKTNGTRYHYTLTANGTVIKELFADTDENGLVTFMLKDNGLYFTQAEIPFSFKIIEHIDFNELTLNDEERNIYTYVEKENEAWVDFGFKYGRLVYVCIVADGVRSTTYIYDCDNTQVSQIPRDKFVQDVILDEDGNIA